jgi:hypothetical protein|eukprot:COSAG06_NODE_47_length_29196_cov_53.194178_4_plen_107_part_00
MPVKYAGQSGFGNHAAAPPSTDERAGRHRAVSASLPGKPKPALDHVAVAAVRVAHPSGCCTVLLLEPTAHPCRTRSARRQQRPSPLSLALNRRRSSASPACRWASA